ncbi:MAG: glycosyltransferase family 2 protein [Proteobacteria bacterium]|nr:glycosyltransferase family 2 protein [Pseudomonadota bacterium]
MGRKVVLIPVYNEAAYISAVLKELRVWHSCDILVINDGSTDGSEQILQQLSLERVSVVSHPSNQGYGASLIHGFSVAIDRGYEYLVTMDCDWQHEPHYVPAFFEALHDCDIVSGSRYLRQFGGDSNAPADRRAINGAITADINSCTGFSLTDAFCGFKGYRVAALQKMALDEAGYAFPLQFWIQAWHFGLTVKELAIPRIYTAANRTFGGKLDDPAIRLSYYRSILSKEVARWGKQ